MRSFIVFSILGQLYGIDIESVKRILPAQPLTHMPDEDAHIEGMFEYEDKVLKVLSFRQMIGQVSYTKELEGMFPDLMCQHKEWIDALKTSVQDGVPFSKTTDPHACHLGKWIDSFHPDNQEVTEIMKALNFHHQRLHLSAVDVLAKRETSKEEACAWIEKNVEEIYASTLSYLQKIADKSAEVAVDLQRCLIINDKHNEAFGVNIDDVDGIIHVEDEKLFKTEPSQHIGNFMEIEAILEHDGKLVTIIKEICVNEHVA